MSIIPYLADGIGFSSYTLKLQRKTVKMESPFTGARQTLAAAYALWAFSGKYTIQDLNKAGALRSFLAQLDGQVNRFKFPLPEVTTPLSAYNGATGLVNGGSQTGSSLITDGWTASTLVLAEGDYFTVNNELKMVTAPVLTNGSGQVTITFKPALRSSPADNLQLFIGNAINLSTYAEDLTQTDWLKSNATASAGTMTVTSTGVAFVYQQQSTGINYSGKQFTYSVELQLGTITGNVQLDLYDGNGVGFASAVLTPTASFVRYSVTGVMPANSADGWKFSIETLGTTNGTKTLNIRKSQLEIAPAFTTYKFVTTGDGKPYIVLASTTDDAASWDLTPPILYNFQLDAIESLS